MFSDRPGGLYGGWSLGTHENSSRTTVWFQNKGWHVLPSYLNTLSNVALRLNPNSKVKGKYSCIQQFLTICSIKKHKIMKRFMRLGFLEPWGRLSKLHAFWSMFVRRNTGC